MYKFKMWNRTKRDITDKKMRLKKAKCLALTTGQEVELFSEESWLR